jgi:hypothetical protein
LPDIVELTKLIISYCKRDISYHPMIELKELIALYTTFAA